MYFVGFHSRGLRAGVIPLLSCIQYCSASPLCSEPGCPHYCCTSPLLSCTDTRWCTGGPGAWEVIMVASSSRSPSHGSTGRQLVPAPQQLPAHPLLASRTRPTRATSESMAWSQGCQGHHGTILAMIIGPRQTPQHQPRHGRGLRWKHGISLSMAVGLPGAPRPWPGRCHTAPGSPTTMPRLRHGSMAWTLHSTHRTAHGSVVRSPPGPLVPC